MKLVATMAAALVLMGQARAAAGQTIGTTYTVMGSAAANGSGCLDSGTPGAYQIQITFKYTGPSKYEVQGLKVQFSEKKRFPNQQVAVCAPNGATTGEVIYTLATDNPLKSGKYGVEAFSPGVQLVAYSSGFCGAKGATRAAAKIRATITPTEVSISCIELNYTASGKSQPLITFK